MSCPNDSTCSRRSIETENCNGESVAPCTQMLSSKDQLESPHRLLIVIVNFRTSSLTIDCLASLEADITVLPDAKVVVVENASGDGSLDRLQSAVSQRGWSRWVRVDPLDQNLGFAGGNNAAIAPAVIEAPDTRPDFVLLLNPDTIVLPGAIVELLQFLEAHPQVGIAGSRLEGIDGIPQCSAFRFPGVFSEAISGFRLGLLSSMLNRFVVAPPIQASAHRTDWVAGACMLVRREVIDRIGLLDQKYFMYYEEVDFCLRAARAGWPCWYLPSARVVHLVGQSSGVTSNEGQTRRLPKYWYQSRRRYFVKNHGRLYALATELAWMVGYLTWKARCWIQRKDVPTVPFRIVDSMRWIVWPLLGMRQGE